MNNTLCWFTAHRFPRNKLKNYSKCITGGIALNNEIIYAHIESAPRITIPMRIII